MRPIDNNKLFSVLKREISKTSKATKSKSSSKDSIQLSNTSKAFNKLSDFLNLGKKNRLNISDLNSSEKEEFLKMLSILLKQGIVGYEILEVNGKPEKHYIVNQIGNNRLKNAKLYNENRYKDYNR